MSDLLQPGDAVPHFRAATLRNPNYAFDTAAGRYLVMGFFGSAAEPSSRAALVALRRRQDLFNDDNFSFFGVTADREDAEKPRVAEVYPGYRYFKDYDFEISKLFGVAQPAGDGKVRFSRTWFVIDPGMRVMKRIAFRADGSDVPELISYLESLPLPPSNSAGLGAQAPILILPDVFEKEFCDALIGLYRKHGGTESGFMVQREGRTVGSYDHSHKRRQDYVITEEPIIRGANSRILRRVVPQIEKAHQFVCTKIERYIVARYGADDGGHFRAHRDNTTTGTAHRRFAVSINLNDDFEGGGVSFPEYSQRTFKAPAGGAVIFSCALLHQVSKVTAGERFAFLPFLYDDAARAIRDKNAHTLAKADPAQAPVPGAPNDLTVSSQTPRDIPPVTPAES